METTYIQKVVKLFPQVEEKDYDAYAEMVAQVVSGTVVDPVHHIVNWFLGRLDLNRGHRALIAAKLVRLTEEESQLVHAPGKWDLSLRLLDVDVANLCGVALYAVLSARRVLDKAPPGLLQAIEAGTLPLKTAEQALIRHRHKPSKKRPWAREDELEEIFALTHELVKRCKADGRLQHLAKTWEVQKKWNLSNELESLSRTLRKWALLIREA